MQIRALIKAAAGRPLRVMFPLVANVDEFRAARAFVDQEVAWALKRGRPAPARLDVGRRRSGRAKVQDLGWDRARGWAKGAAADFADPVRRPSS